MLSNRIVFVFLAICSIFVLSLSFSKGYCSSPRLLITLGGKCDFDYTSVQKEIDAIVVSGEKKEIKNIIKKLDQSQKIHIMVLSQTPNNIKTFALSIGYAYVHLNKKKPEAFKLLKETIHKIPLTDASLKRTNPTQVGKLYHLMMTVDHIFKENNIPYWATCGTLLGVIRHKGIIPWDDDLDIAIFEKDEKQLLTLKKTLFSHGLKICYHRKLDFYKIYYKNGQPILKENGKPYRWTYPFVDIFPLVKVKEKLTYRGKIWQNQFKGKDYFLPEDLVFPLNRLPFGPMRLPIPARPLDYILRMYEADWNKVAYVSFDHQNEKFLTKVKVDLVDRSQPAYILYVPRSS